MDRVRSLCEFSFFLEIQKKPPILTPEQSTVMLATNVGFLAIQSVIPPSNGGWIKASPAQIASSMSLVFSIGSIITGLLLIRRNRTMAKQDPTAAVRRTFLISCFLAD
jgi:hypothetical protein